MLPGLRQPFLQPALVEAAVAKYYQNIELGDTICGRSKDTVRRQQARVDQLRTQEQKLLHLFYRNKITDELFEQERPGSLANWPTLAARWRPSK